MTPEPSIWAELLWAGVGLGLIAYVLSGGADLGAGLWGLLARGRKREAEREAIVHAIAPIWEANHVWLIFVIVILFSAFPRAFAVLGVALHVPLGLALVGIVLRGAAYSFHAYGIQGEQARHRWSRVFSWASCWTPIFLGTVVGGVSTGAIRVQQGVVTSGYFAGWTSAFAWLVGLFVLSLFALLAACYLAAEVPARLSDYFRRRAIVTEVIAGLLAAAVFALASNSAPLLFASFTRSPWFWPIQLGTGASALGTLFALVRRRTRLARSTVMAQLVLIVLGWGVGMDGHFILPDVSITSAGSQPEVLPALTVALGLGSVVLLPALYYLYRVFKLR